MNNHWGLVPFIACKTSLHHVLINHPRTNDATEAACIASQTKRNQLNILLILQVLVLRYPHPLT